MIRALALLGLWKLRNSLKAVLTDPRKLFPALLMIVAFSAPMAMLALLLGPLNPSHGFKSFPHRGAAGVSHVLPDPSILVVAVGIASILFAVIVVLMVLGGGLLAFSMPDVDYVFPSPISRRVVLAFKLPSITGRTVLSIGIPAIMLGVMMNVLPQFGGGSSFVGFPWWATPIGIFSSLGIYVNLALLAALTVKSRVTATRIYGIFAGFAALCLILLGSTQGTPALHTMITTGWMRWAFLPSSLATEILSANITHQVPHHQIAFLLTGYVLTFLPILAVRTNWYEQSIVMTERASAMRDAIKAGASPFAVMMKPATTKARIGAGKLYTIPAFGLGAWALVWANFCAAGKKPLLICGGPLAAGIVFGVYGTLLKIHTFSPTSYVSVDKTGQMKFYSFSSMNATMDSLAVFTQFMFFATVCIFFQTYSQMATQSAIKRRELINPLPIPGYQAVAADLAVPFSVLIVLCVSATVTAAIAGRDALLLFAFNMCLLLPMRIGARMVLQYLVLLGYPDAGDPMNKLMSGITYGVAATPLIIIELFVALPAILFHSVWSAVLPLAIIQIPFFIGLLMLTGKARDKAIATGEPVTVLGTLRNA